MYMKSLLIQLFTIYDYINIDMFDTLITFQKHVNNK